MAGRTSLSSLAGCYWTCCCFSPGLSLCVKTIVRVQRTSPLTWVCSLAFYPKDSEQEKRKSSSRGCCLKPREGLGLDRRRLCLTLTSSGLHSLTSASHQLLITSTFPHPPSLFCMYAVLFSLILSHCCPQIMLHTQSTSPLSCLISGQGHGNQTPKAPASYDSRKLWPPRCLELLCLWSPRTWTQCVSPSSLLSPSLSAKVA